MTEDPQTDPDDTERNPERSDPGNDRGPKKQESRTSDDSREPGDNHDDSDAIVDDRSSEHDSPAGEEGNDETTSSQERNNRYVIDLEDHDSELNDSGLNNDEADIDTANADASSETGDEEPRHHGSSSQANNELTDQEEQPDHKTDSAPPDPETYAAIHRSLGDTGVRLNEAHSHLSSLRSIEYAESEEDNEVARAEIEALVATLVETQEQLNQALNRATAAANELDVEVPVKDSREQAVDEQLPEMLWNTYRR